MTRRVRTSPGAAYEVGYHVVWCPKYRRPVLGGRVKERLELIHAKAGERGWEIVALEVMPDHGHLRSRLPTLWSRSYFVATVGAASAETVQRYIETQCERPKRCGRA
ncbi:transposase [Microbispora rosea]|uniref:transposase n=1 Tax=Microbispora rosea TaxID=58117 RepID=UPI00341A8375